LSCPGYLDVRPSYIRPGEAVALYRFGNESDRQVCQAVRCRPRHFFSTLEVVMPSKLRRSRTAVKFNVYRSALALGSLLVLLEALGAPRKL